MKITNVKTEKKVVETKEKIIIRFQVEYKNDFPFDFKFNLPIARIKK